MESAIAPYFFGVLVIIAAVLWIWGQYDIRRYERESRSEKEDDEEGKGGA